MGLSSKKTTSKTTPIYEAEIKGAYGNSSNTYQDNKGVADDISGQFAGLVPQLLSQYQQGDPTINAAQGYAQDVIGGKYLNNNPHLQGIIDQTNDSVTDRTNAGIGIRGQTGGSGHYEGLSNNLAQNEGRLRWEDYAQERQNMAQMAGLSSSLAAGQQIPLAAAMSAGESAVNLPWVGANNHARNTSGLLGQYTNQEQKSSGGLLGQLIGAGLSGWASGGFGGI